MSEKPLVVVSAVKHYAKGKTGVRCSEGCADVLHRLARQAMDHALLRMEQEPERKTLLARDFDGLFVMDGRVS